MTLPPRLDSALSRLEQALDHLEAASERRRSGDASRRDLDEELAVMQDDRARLAVELDGALARSQALALANGEVRRRLEQAGEAVRAMIGADGEAVDNRDVR